MDSWFWLPQLRGNDTRELGKKKKDNKKDKKEEKDQPPSELIAYLEELGGLDECWRPINKIIGTASLRAFDNGDYHLSLSLDAPELNPLENECDYIQENLFNQMIQVLAFNNSTMRSNVHANMRGYNVQPFQPMFVLEIGNFDCPDITSIRFAEGLERRYGYTKSKGSVLIKNVTSSEDALIIPSAEIAPILGALEQPEAEPISIRIMTAVDKNVTKYEHVFRVDTPFCGTFDGPPKKEKLKAYIDPFNVLDRKEECGDRMGEIGMVPWLQQAFRKRTEAVAAIEAKGELAEVKETEFYEVKGKVYVEFYNDDAFKLKYDLRGLPPNCERCEIHIHRGYSCDILDDPHYYDPHLFVDPWSAENSAYYTSDKYGNAKGYFILKNGYNFVETIGHVVDIHRPAEGKQDVHGGMRQIVDGNWTKGMFHSHDQVGPRIGCGILEIAWSSRRNLA